MKKHLITIAFFIFFAITGFTQDDPKATISGVVTDASNGEAIEFVTVYIKGTNTGAESTANGRYTLEVPAKKAFHLVFTRIGYKETSFKIKALPVNSSRQLDLALAPADTELEVIITGKKIEEAEMVREEVTQLKHLPTTTGNLESVLPHIALGTSSGTGGELSSQYNVRGGNYDENLVYVNDFEIYRPQLIRSGQQEGLTFANIDLINSLSFSSGGFQAKYGDKMSSVLDIKYKRPDSLRASVGMSFLGGSAHIEGSKKLGNSQYRKFRYLVGTRYKTTRYLLGGLDVSGEYAPNFADIQTYLTYDLNYNWQLGFLGNFNSSVYKLTPTERTTAFNQVNYALQLYSVFEGEESDNFNTLMGGLSLTYMPERNDNPFYLKFLTSAYKSYETERFDILGYYSLREIDTNSNSSSFGEVLNELGNGIQHQFVRNFLDINVVNFEHKGGIELQVDPKDEEAIGSHFFQWSAKFQSENIHDNIHEWERLDSAGYSLPYDDSQVRLQNVLNTKNQLFSNRFSAYFQDTYTRMKAGKGELKLTGGVRMSYWDTNKEFLVSPRAQLLYKPLEAKRDISYKLAGGLYFQSPFYRELRRLDGSINEGLLAQKSAHIVGGMTWDFHFGKNPNKFRFITEAYYKFLWDLVSYDIDNVRIRYSGENDATGYVTGIDFRLNGEFVPGAESWINLSFLRAREKLDGVEHIERRVGQEEGTVVKDVARPTDRFMNLSMFFQDYLPKNKNIKMHLNLNIGTGLPFGIKDNNLVHRNTYRYDAYHRVDIGFALALWDESRLAKRPRHPFRFTKSTWLSLEVFNLMQVQNQAGNTWIKTIFLKQYAVPNHLTSRRINLRLKMDF